jgi:hypothetical protein
MIVYPASKSKHAPWWRALRAAGMPIVAPWIDSPLNAADAPEPSADQWRMHWSGCITAATEADICLFVCNEGEQACGGLIEAGAALASGKQVFVVSPYAWSFSHHPRARAFGSLEAAVGSIMARKAGERPC